MVPPRIISSFFFFNDTATTEIYTLSLHDALPICARHRQGGRSAHRDHRGVPALRAPAAAQARARGSGQDRKSTRLNSSHSQISYAVFCLKKKKHNMTCHLDEHCPSPLPSVPRSPL